MKISFAKNSVALTVLTLVSSFVFFSGCKSTLPAVDINADAEVLEELAGDWFGTYNSRDSGRSGSIAFLLTSDPDSAFGDVVMEHEDHDWEMHDASIASLRRNHSERLYIQFVALNDEMLVGELEPYRDPECGCMLFTAFHGKISDDTISGTFTSRHDATDRVDQGTWSVERRR
ncbi:MAG: hypothetical protein HKN43_01345 [Rhodothermales bacterium]|nr:hypothetical protein [Rhodothermales bacterium]